MSLQSIDRAPAPRAIARLIIGNSMPRNSAYPRQAVALASVRMQTSSGTGAGPVMGMVVKGRDDAMATKIQFLQCVAAIGFAALLAAVPTRLSAQQTPQSAI